MTYQGNLVVLRRGIPAITSTASDGVGRRREYQSSDHGRDGAGGGRVAAVPTPPECCAGSVIQAFNGTRIAPRTSGKLSKTGRLSWFRRDERLSLLGDNARMLGGVDGM